MSLQLQIISRQEQLEAHRRDFADAWENIILPQLEREFSMTDEKRLLAHRRAWNRWLADADRKARQ